MTLVVVSSSLTTYPLQNNKNTNLLFLKKLNIKKIEFNFKNNIYYSNIFQLKNFYNNIKLLYYYFYFEKSFNFNKFFCKNTYYVCLNKKKKPLLYINY